MTKALNQSVDKALRLFEALLADGFRSKPLLEVAVTAGVNSTTAWRMLKTLEAHGWVVEKSVAGSKLTRWQVAARLAGVAHAYERDALSRVQAVRQEYRNTTGDELTHG